MRSIRSELKFQLAASFIEGNQWWNSEVVWLSTLWGSDSTSINRFRPTHWHHWNRFRSNRWVQNSFEIPRCVSFRRSLAQRNLQCNSSWIWGSFPDDSDRFPHLNTIDRKRLWKIGGCRTTHLHQRSEKPPNFSCSLTKPRLSTNLNSQGPNVDIFAGVGGSKGSLDDKCTMYSESDAFPGQFTTTSRFRRSVTLCDGGYQVWKHLNV